MYFISYIIIMIYMFIGRNRKLPLFLILSYALLFIHLYTIEISKYLGMLVLSMLNFYNYVKENKIKDLYLSGIYTSILIIFYMVLGDLNLFNYSILTYGILIVYLLIITRTIIYKYIDYIKTLEYIGLVTINLLSLMSYNNEINGIYYTSFLVLLTMFSYIKKYGPSFLVSIIFILINIFLLTREFWFSIPWWLYILIIGIILILFAMNNELKNKDLIKTKFNKIKEKFKL